MELMELPRYPVCPRCEREMRPGGGCDASTWHQDGREIPPTRYGSEHVGYHPEACHDCGAGVGATHHYSCTIEECPHRNQAVTCDACVPLEHDPYYTRSRGLH